MDNQHRKISNYRELNQEEIDLMNEIKAKGSELEELMVKVHTHVANLEDNEKPSSLRSISIAGEKLQTGMMWLTRAVARPHNFG